MIDIGGTVPLNLQLYDGREDLSVQAFVLTPDLELLEQVELLHLAGGLYVSRSVLMPDVPYLIANYVVMDGNKESQDYERSSDVFYANQAPVDVQKQITPLFDDYTPKKSDYLVGQITYVESKDDFIEGKITHESDKT